MAGIQKGSPSKAEVVCESNTTALFGEAALFVPRYERHSAVAPSDFDRLISGQRLTQPTLLGTPYCMRKARPETSVYPNSLLFFASPLGSLRSP